jgi:Ketopantoate reductase PanE/ApbA
MRADANDRVTAPIAGNPKVNHAQRFRSHRSLLTRVGGPGDHASTERRDRIEDPDRRRWRCGGYFGAQLAAAWRDVTFLVRPNCAEALQAHGLHVTSPNGDLGLKPRLATVDDLTSPHRTIFPQMTNWLPEEEGARLRFELEAELARLEAA